MCMKLVGVKTIQEIKPEMCCSKDLTTHTVESPRSFLTIDLYEPLKHASKLWFFLKLILIFWIKKCIIYLFISNIINSQKIIAFSDSQSDYNKYLITN